MGQELDYQLILDRENRILRQIFVPAIEDLRRQRAMSSCRNDEVDMTRPIGVPIQQGQEPARGTIKRNRIRSRPQCIKRKAAILVSLEPTP